jgi:hypothetical protein
MQTRRLGNSDLEITPIGIGAWAMGGGDWAFSWGRQEDGESIAAHGHLLRGLFQVLHGAADILTGGIGEIKVRHQAGRRRLLLWHSAPRRRRFKENQDSPDLPLRKQGRLVHTRQGE